MMAFTTPFLLLGGTTDNLCGPLERSGAGYRASALANVAELEHRREYGLDSTLAETFPCSDPLSSIPNPDLPTD